MAESGRRFVNIVEGDVHGTLVQLGELHGDLHVHQEPRAPLTLPGRSSWPPLAGAFEQRGACVELADAVEAVHTVVLSGMGGIGKSQLAVWLAEQVWAAGAADLVLWLTASSRSGLVWEYARWAAVVTGVDDRDPEAGARRLLDWLAATSARWLIVLDDLQSPQDLATLWPPRNATGRVVVTTRRRDAALRSAGRRVLHVDPFTPQESESYLLTTLADTLNAAEGAADLGAELGHLPLALAQAAAVVVEQEKTCAWYLAELRDRRRALDALGRTLDMLPDDQEHTVAAAWSLSVEQADRMEPAGLAGRVLAALALLDPHGAPEAILTAAPVAERLGADVEQVRQALRNLHKLSLLTHSPHETHTEVRVHVLVQRATRDQYPASVAAEFPRAVATALLTLWPPVERDIGLAHVLRRNTSALHRAAGEALWQPEPHPVLVFAENSLASSGQLTAALDHFAELRARAMNTLAPDHPYTLSIRFAIAHWLATTSDIKTAAAEYESVLSARQRVLGADHPDTLTTRAALARLRGFAGDAAGALAVSDDLVARWQHAAEPDRLQVVLLRTDRATWLGTTEGPARALAELDALLDEHLPALGPNNPLLLAARGHRALWQHLSGDTTGAASAMEQVIEDHTTVLGPLHPQTLALRGSLAHLRAVTHGPAHGVSELETLLDDQLQVFDAEHPQVRGTRHAITVMREAAPPPEPQ
ncbi:NB-ARC domain-containing protein [Lentzea terrae]|uniref:NB-ARC domain-containing protein n=1 Tax=Lentzea terrae TaxID=2200761 RepID=UPI000DD2FDA3|nr:tetratricopeptide repeat protein [Lentzea terrae]